MIAIAACAACGLWWRAIRRRWLPVVVTAFVFAGLFAPFAVASQRATGSITGILHLSERAAERAYFGQALRSYVTRIPFRSYGVVLSPLALVGLVAAVVRRDRVRCFLAIVALGQLVALGLVSHASPRFIFVALCLLALLGLDLLCRARVIVRHPLAARRTAAGVLVGAWLGMVIAIVPIERKIARGLYDVVGSARAVAADAGSAPCTIAARAVPQVMWYSGCAVVWVNAEPREFALPEGRRWYVADTPKRSVDVARLGSLAHARARRLWPWHAWALER